MSQDTLEVGSIVRTPGGVGRLQGYVYNRQLTFAVVDLWPAAGTTTLRPVVAEMSFFPVDVVQRVDVSQEEAK